MKDNKKPQPHDIIKTVSLVFSILFIFLSLLTESQGQPLYNTTNLTTANNIYDQAIALNEILGNNIIGFGILLIVTVITFSVTTGNTGDVLTGFGAASFIAGFSAMILLPLKFINFEAFKISILLSGVSVFLSMILRR